MSEYKEYTYHNADLTWSHQYLLHPLEKLLEHDHDKTILDIGCGNGALVCHLLRKGYNVYGIDASESGIAIAQKQYPDRFFVQNIDTASLPDELSDIPFNLIISTEVVEHLYAPRIYMQFIRSILNKSGGGCLFRHPIMAT